MRRMFKKPLGSSTSSPTVGKATTGGTASSSYAAKPPGKPLGKAGAAGFVPAPPPKSKPFVNNSRRARNLKQPLYLSDDPWWTSNFTREPLYHADASSSVLDESTRPSSFAPAPPKIEKPDSGFRGPRNPNYTPLYIPASPELAETSFVPAPPKHGRRDMTSRNLGNARQTTSGSASGAKKPVKGSEKLWWEYGHFEHLVGNPKEKGIVNSPEEPFLPYLRQGPTTVLPNDHKYDAEPYVPTWELAARHRQCQGNPKEKGIVNSPEEPFLPYLRQGPTTVLPNDHKYDAQPYVPSWELAASHRRVQCLKVHDTTPDPDVAEFTQVEPLRPPTRRPNNRGYF